MTQEPNPINASQDELQNTDTEETSTLSNQANISEPPSSNTTQASHAESTERIRAWSEFVSALANFLKAAAPFLWAIVIIIVIIPLIGQVFIGNAFKTPEPIDRSLEKSTIVVTDWSQVDQAVREVLNDAHKSAESYANKELDKWVDDLMNRVDPAFLDWYFGYFNQKQIEYKSFFTGIRANLGSWLNPDGKKPEEQIAEIITEDFQTEFAKRVLRPQIAQMQLERIANDTVRHYLNQAQGSIKQIPVMYDLPQADWNRYLEDVAVNIYDTEGQTTSFSLKAIAGGGAYFAVKPVIAPLLPVITTKVVAKLAGKTGAKIATKTGGVVAGKIGSALLDTTVGVGIILWDVWDTYHTANVERPILKENLADYLQEVKNSLLSNPENGIMTAVDKVQEIIIDSIAKS